MRPPPTRASTPCARRWSAWKNPRYSRDYLDPDKRSIANAVQVFFNDGTQTEKVEVEYPLGHRRRRAEAVPLLREKFAENLSDPFPRKPGVSDPRLVRQPAAPGDNASPRTGGSVYDLKLKRDCHKIRRQLAAS